MSNTTYADPRRVVTELTMERGDEITVFEFPRTGPTPETMPQMQQIVQLMIEGFVMTDHKMEPYADD
jgi:hypothetical protein